MHSLQASPIHPKQNTPSLATKCTRLALLSVSVSLPLPLLPVPMPRVFVS